MSLKFFNIRSKEVRVAETEPQISALWSSSDHSPNAQQGQDFGWRLAPEVVIQVEKIRQNPDLLLQIASRFSKNYDELNEPDLLTYISMTTAEKDAPVANDADYSDEYSEEIRRLRLEDAEKNDTDTIQTATTTTTESLEDMAKRAELEERIAKAKREQAEAENVTTTTTTTKVPVNTSTTTKK